MTQTEQVGELLAAAGDAYARGELLASRSLAEAAALADPASAAACNLLGIVAFADGQREDAVRSLRRAHELDPSNAEYPNNLGVVLHALGDFAAARPAFERALALDPSLANAANNLGSILEHEGEAAAAIGRYRQALELDPIYVEARDNLLLACAKAAPQWHFPMIADGARNAAYAEALDRAAPGRRVLDIGSGSGLLAMLAARAGAASVATCEMQPVIAGLAKEIVRRNGLSEKVAVHALKSDQLQPGEHLAELAEVIVTETFSSGLLSEQVLPTLEDAHARLAAPGAVVIPKRAAAWGYLLGGQMVEDHLFAASWDGLDLSAFDVLAPFKLGLHLDRIPHQALSADFELVGFDLRQPPFPSERRIIEVEATASGRCVGVAQWIRLDLDETTTYENRPSDRAGSNGWMHVVYRFAHALEVSPGDRIPILVGHNRTEMIVGLARSPA